MRKRKLLIVAGACLATLSLTVGSAMADPTGPVPPPHRELAGVGAETTQGVFNFLSDIIKIDGTNKTIASYDNAPPGNIQTKADPNCTIVRPRPLLYRGDPPVQQPNQSIPGGEHH
jgi:hypothetical protein